MSDNTFPLSLALCVQKKSVEALLFAKINSKSMLLYVAFTGINSRRQYVMWIECVRDGMSLFQYHPNT